MQAITLTHNASLPKSSPKIKGFMTHYCLHEASSKAGCKRNMIHSHCSHNAAKSPVMSDLGWYTHSSVWFILYVLTNPSFRARVRWLTAHSADARSDIYLETSEAYIVKKAARLLWLFLRQAWGTPSPTVLWHGNWVSEGRSNIRFHHHTLESPENQQTQGQG